MSLTNFLSAWIFILKGNVKINNEIIPIIKDYSYKDNTPCIIFDDSPGSVVLRRYIVHDEHEHFVRELEQSLNIHVYADSEIQRRKIVNQIEDLYKKSMMNYYKFCMNYQKTKGFPESFGHCKKLNKTCLVETQKNNYRSVKGKCPEPEKSDYLDFLVFFQINKNSFDLQPSFDLDDFSLNTPLYHSIFRTSAIFTDDYDIGGKLSEIKFDTIITKEE